VSYSVFERLTLAVGVVAVGATVVSGLRAEPVWEELAAQALLLIVLVGAVHWGRNGGFVTAAGASLIYVIMRIPLLVEQGLEGAALELVLIRMLTFGVVGVLGGELCTRVKYIFASMEDANSLDPETRVFNERFVGRRLLKCLGEHLRYGTEVSVVILTLDPGLYLPLRRGKQRQVLRSVATHVRNDIRLVDDLGRLNDSRFLMVLPHTPRSGGEVAAERTRRAVRDLLGARDDSVAVRVLGTPEDTEAIAEFVQSLDVRDPEPVGRDATAG
jgi:GGDEF domain-containing protein